MNSKYVWVITDDYIDGSKAVGLVGPRGVPKGATVDKNEGQAFRLKDDDGEVYYHGRIKGDYSGFEPLTDFGMPYAGCTTVELREGSKWVRL